MPHSRRQNVPRAPFETEARRPPRRRGLARAAVLLLFGVLAVTLAPASAGLGQGPRPRLFVFLLTTLRPHALQKNLEQELPQLSITAFGRSSDFEAALSATPPDAVLALRPVLSAHQLRPALQGYRGTASAEDYVLISVGRELVPSVLSDKVVGVVDLLGRKGTSAVVAELFGAAKPKVKRVARLEDLLFLLQLNMADAVFASRSNYEELKQISELDLRASKIEGAGLGLPAVALLTDAGRTHVGPGIMRISSALAGQIGVSSWKAE